MDFGIMLYASHGGAGSYTTVTGEVGTPRTLTNANYISSDEIYVGAGQSLALVVDGVISVGLASVVFIVEAKQRDAANPTLTNWSVIGTVRSDSPSTAPAASQTVTRANLAGQSVADGLGGGASTETLGVRLLTTDFQAATQVRVIAKATNATQAGDRVTIHAAVR
jgi:hypothetical protein